MQPIALVPRGVSIPFSELALVASAIQIQLFRDIAPAWQISATCTPFPSLADVPSNHWMVFVAADADGNAGFHSGRAHPELPPCAVVQYKPELEWSIAASHEIIEMLVDPRGDRLFRGPDPQDFSKQVEFLAEVCDPCQSEAFSYAVDSAHPALMSDFCLPSFYGMGISGPPYSAQKSVNKPFSLARGGYMSWRDSEGRWFQLFANSGLPNEVSESDVMGFKDHNFRGFLDRREQSYHGPASKLSKATRAKLASLRKSAVKQSAAKIRLVETYLQEIGL